LPIFCHNSKNVTNFLANENVDFLRTIENYEDNVLKYDSKQTVIFENSIFNTVNSYHVVENYAVDLMHDNFEGVGVYNMCHIILTFLKQGCQL
jgi:lipopolysaccharide biosynthesis protein